MLFYIHINNGVGFLADEEGSDFASLEAAERAAIYAGADIIADEIKSGCQSVEVTLLIEDEKRSLVVELPIKASINLSRH